MLFRSAPATVPAARIRAVLAKLETAPFIVFARRPGHNITICRTIRARSAILARSAHESSAAGFAVLGVKASPAGPFLA